MAQGSGDQTGRKQKGKGRKGTTAIFAEGWMESRGKKATGKTLWLLDTMYDRMFKMYGGGGGGGMCQRNVSKRTHFYIAFSYS